MGGVATAKDGAPLHRIALAADRALPLRSSDRLQRDVVQTPVVGFERAVFGSRTLARGERRVGKTAHRWLAKPSQHHSAAYRRDRDLERNPAKVLAKNLLGVGAEGLGALIKEHVTSAAAEHLLAVAVENELFNLQQRRRVVVVPLAGHRVVCGPQVSLDRSAVLPHHSLALGRVQPLRLETGGTKAPHRDPGHVLDPHVRGHRLAFGVRDADLYRRKTGGDFVNGAALPQLPVDNAHVNELWRLAKRNLLRPCAPRIRGQRHRESQLGDPVYRAAKPALAGVCEQR